MINKTSLKYICKNIENIENYQEAIADTENIWHCHHRLECHDSSGNRREVDITRAELEALGLYYNRPAEELIFMKAVDHCQLHRCGKKFDEEWRGRMSESAKNRQKHPNTGKTFSAEWRKNMSEAAKRRWALKNKLCN